MAKKSGSTPGDVVRYTPASEPLVAAGAIAALTMIEVVFSVMFVFLLVTSGPSMKGQHLDLGA